MIFTSFQTGFLKQSVWPLLKESVQSAVGSINWGIVLERFWTRLLFVIFDKLRSMNTNDLTSETINDIAADLMYVRLPKSKQVVDAINSANLAIVQKQVNK